MMSKKRVTICFQGRLGNQMFQYAFGKYIEKKFSIKTKYTYLFHPTMDVQITPYYFDLVDVFRINATVYKYNFDNHSLFLKIYLKIRNIICWGFYDKILQIVYREKTMYHFDSNIKIGHKKYLLGGWQSYKYVDFVKEQIYQDFIPRYPLTCYSQGILNDIETQNISVAIHVRRGDYVLLYWHLGLEYYKSAWEFISEKYNGITAYVFSDDIQWCKQHFNFIPNPVFITPPTNTNQSTEHEDIILMSKCTHNIIANSTYAWWGAYLNQNPEKMVIASKWWDDYAHGIIPPDWHLL